MLRKILVFFLSLSLCLTTVACGSSTQTQYPSQPNVNNKTVKAPSRIADGKYPVQQATYDDGNGEYSLMLLNTPAGSSPVFHAANIQMARLTDEQIKAGEKTYLEVTNNQPVMYLTEDFKIEYVHNVTETQTNPQTGQPQTVVVRQESNFWTPFAGAVAGNLFGQALGSLLFRPQYYVPPVYRSGGNLVGYGGYGSSYNDAVNDYQRRYQEPPAAVRNRQVLRTTGNLRRPSSGFGSTTRNPSSGFGSTTRRTTPRTAPNPTKSTGSGFGSSTLRNSGRSPSSGVKRSTGFGSGSSYRSPVRSGGRRR